MPERRITIEVAAGFSNQQILVELEVPAGTTAAEAVELVRLEERLPGHDIDLKRIGIFGRRCDPEKALQHGDRVEVYRPLKADPKEVRRRLAELERSNRR